MIPLLMIALVAVTAAAPARAAAVDDDLRFEGFRRVASLGLGPVLAAVFASDSVLAAVDSLPAGQALRFDLDGDGRIDCLAYRDGSVRVAAIDPKGDFAPDGTRADTVDDCLVVDGNQDGIPERIVDYHDTDGDGRADREDLYEIFPGSIRQGTYVLTYLDLDHDGRMLHLTDYGYHANRDMWESDFDGDACFLAGRRNEQTGAWTSCDENPFCFYDHDGDGHSDEAVRLEGNDLSLRSLRWSFDADGDAPAKGAPDYDFSITAVGSVPAPEAFADSVVLRDGRALRFVSWKRARDLARWALWRSALLVWDEEDHNVAPASEAPDRPRWEGVIADAWPPMPAVGGPGCGRIDKRYELAPDLHDVPLGIYFSTVDERIHLRGAARMETDVTLPADPPVQRTITAGDGNGDGYLDTWSWLRKSGAGRTVRLRDPGARALPLDAMGIRRFWTGALAAARDRATWDGQQLERSIERSEPTEVKSWWVRARDRNDPLAARAAGSIEADRFVKDLILLEMGGGFLARDPNERKPGASIAVPRARGPVEIPLDPLPEDARKLLNAWTPVELAGPFRSVPGQVEDDRIWFPEFPDEGAVTLDIDPVLPHPYDDVRIRTDPWIGRSIGVENDSVAYRFYDGHLDLLTKARKGWILRHGLGDYHRPQPWGMDALDIGTGPGIAGLYALTDGRWVPLFGQARVKEQRLAADGPFRARVETVLEDSTGALAVSRSFVLAERPAAVTEDLRIERSPAPAVVLAAAIAPLAGGGDLPDSAGIWSFGVSVPEAREIGLAGAVLGGADHVTIIRIGGAPAIRFEATPGRAVRLAWVAGGGAFGEPTAPRWVRRAARILGRSRP